VEKTWQWGCQPPAGLGSDLFKKPCSWVIPEEMYVPGSGSWDGVKMVCEGEAVASLGSKVTLFSSFDEQGLAMLVQDKTCSLNARAC